MAREDPDVICLSEVKCREADNPLKLPGYTCFFHESKLKKGGYAGIAFVRLVSLLDGLITDRWRWPECTQSPSRWMSSGV